MEDDSTSRDSAAAAPSWMRRFTGPRRRRERDSENVRDFFSRLRDGLSRKQDKIKPVQLSNALRGHYERLDPAQSQNAPAPALRFSPQSLVHVGAVRCKPKPARPRLTEATFSAEATSNTPSEDKDPARLLARFLSTTNPKTNVRRCATVGSRPSSHSAPVRTREQEERCYDPNDPTLRLVDGEDDMDFELNEYKSLRAQMSCGHTVTPSSLMNWCRRLLDQGETRFVCGQPGCDVKWSFEEVYKKALMTPEEIDYFDTTLFNRVAKTQLDAKTCPGCKSLVMRKDLNDLRVICTVCSGKNGKSFQFCWQCLKEWKRPSPHSDRCAEPGCVSVSLEILRRCPEIIFEDVRNVTGCPSVRACPTCGLLIEHNKKKCKNIACQRCKVEFCFVCLRLTKECLSSNQYSHFTPCPTSGVAPRQTSIPVWRKGN